jgi:hypothetical protein
VSIAAGALALIVLQAVVSSRSAPGAVGGIFGSLAAAVGRFLDPTVPGLPGANPSAGMGSAGPAGTPGGFALSTPPATVPQSYPVVPTGLGPVSST